MTDAPREHRRHPRFGVDIHAKATLDDGQILEARTRDVSQTGICLITPRPLTAGTTVKLELVLSIGDSPFTEPLVLDAHVVWCTPLGAQYQIGAMFEDLADEQEGYLDVFLQFLDGSLAPKGVKGMEDSAAGADAADDDEPPPVRPEDKDDPFKN